MLYAAANASLTRTIEELGIELVQSKVQELHQLQTLAESQCSSEAIWPCSPNGTNQLYLSAQNCYKMDFGCGYQCVDRVLMNKN